MKYKVGQRLQPTKCRSLPGTVKKIGAETGDLTAVTLLWDEERETQMYTEYFLDIVYDPAVICPKGNPR